ncbi:alpha/beta hydrolase [Neobacillus sp. OS1-2]|uniref:alpha/beta hydrolase n=1 Tax=Neobacillus sp. OS1-2 TaxID=3070680 RepID=UPI0027DEADE4|nr:alpha/beta hydrolase [Neobacillus sp. OS1-2]WML39417.1 alpha/beta hydrolase [Neobacillus sp. OS1-2]
MPSFQSYFFEKAIKLSVKRTLRKGVKGKGMDEKRQMLDAAARRLGKLPKNCQVTPLEIEGLYAEWITSGLNSQLADKVILYLHGGGYALCSANTHRPLAARIGKAAGVKVLFPEYRLAPEHPFPAAIEDAVTVYRWLLHQGYDPANIIFAGDSAGGGLSIATALVLRDQNEPLPAAIVLLSPWVDLTSSGESYRKNEGLDPYLSLKAVREAVHMYAGKEAPDHPLISPVYADLSGLPPLFIQAGNHEILQSDAETLAAQARKAGVPVRMKIWQGMWHVWQIGGDALPEAKKAIWEIGNFVRNTFEKGRSGS